MKISTAQSEPILSIAQSVLDRFESDRLSRVPLLHLKELPEIPGVYFVLTDDLKVLYVGKADNLQSRCNLGTHHKLKATIEKGAVYLAFAGVSSHAWHVEQWLIDRLNSPMNERVSRWWEKLISEVDMAPVRKKHDNNISVKALRSFAEYGVSGILMTRPPASSSTSVEESTCIVRTEESFKALLKGREQTQLSEWLSNNIKVKIRCDKGHVFEKTPYQYAIAKIKCIDCSKFGKKFSDRRFLQMVELKGDKLVTPMSQNIAEFECRCGSRYHMLPKNYMKSVYTCMECRPSISTAKEFESLVELKGSKMLTPYKNNATKLKIKWRCGHIEDITPHSYRGRRGCCPAFNSDLLSMV